MVSCKHGGDFIKNIGFPIDEELYTKLKIICLKKGVTLKEYMTKLIEKEVEKEEKSDKK